jgi:hypothetical protein
MYEIEIPIVPPRRPCAVVTRIIYRSIDQIVRQRLVRSGQTTDAVSLNAVFARLLDDRLDSFMSTLDPATRDTTCVRTVELLKWIKGDSVTAFGFGEYRLEPRLRGVLDAVAGAVSSSERNWPTRRVEIVATGFTDAVEVKSDGIELSFADAGLPASFAASRTPEVRFHGCAGNVLAGPVPQPLSLSSNSGRSVGRRVDDNCELSAVRGYLVARYLAEVLKRGWIEYRYAAGGVSAASNAAERNRRVELTIKLQGARETRAPVH